MAEDPAAGRCAGAALVAKALEYWCRLNRYWGDKPKRIVAYVEERNALLGGRVRAFYAGGLEPAKAYEIVDLVLAPVGGRLQVWESAKIPYPNETRG